MSVIDDLLRRNRAYGETFDLADLPARPAMGLAILTCMDARIDVYRIFGLSEGDAHVIRNAGGLATDDAIRSLVISQRRLDTREIVVVQHTGCGLLGLDEDALRREIADEAGETPGFEFGAFPDLEDSVRQSMEKIRRSRFLAQRDEVRGFIYDVATGGVSEVKAP